MPELLRGETQYFDENHFYCEYQELSWRDQTLRHIGEHVTKAGLKLVDYEEGTSSVDVVREQIVPDLAIYRTQIINLLEFDPEDIDWHAHRGDEANLSQSILWAAGMMNRYIEPSEHTSEARHENLTIDSLESVPVRLHFVASVLAAQHDIDLVESQRKRMEK